MNGLSSSLVSAHFRSARYLLTGAATDAGVCSRCCTRVACFELPGLPNQFPSEPHPIANDALSSGVSKGELTKAATGSAFFCTNAVDQLKLVSLLGPSSALLTESPELPLRSRPFR